MQSTLPKPSTAHQARNQLNNLQTCRYIYLIQENRYRSKSTELTSLWFFLVCLNSKWNFQLEITGLEKSFRTKTILTKDQVSNLLWYILAWSKSMFLVWLIRKLKIYWKSFMLDHYWKGFAVCMWQNASSFPICLSEEYRMGYLIWTFLYLQLLQTGLKSMFSFDTQFYDSAQKSVIREKLPTLEFIFPQRLSVIYHLFIS